MTTQDYIQEKLDELKQPLNLPQPANEEELIETICRLITSKKFRKYSLTPAYSEHIKHAVRQNVQSKKPINLTFLGGCYKLWRLDESPESDWAELFACMYYTKWLQPICEIYEPGVWFDFFLDDVIVSRMNNVPEEDVETYYRSRQQVLDFLRPYQPPNMSMTLTRVGEKFVSRDAYEESLKRNLKKLEASLAGGLPKLSEAEAASVELNVRVTPEQQSDPQWREKVELLHQAYYMAKRETGYAGSADKIVVFTVSLSSGQNIAVGTTKDSIAKFWVGVGALKPKADSFRQIVLSPSQLEKSKVKFEYISINGLDGKNFHQIRILQT